MWPVASLPQSFPKTFFGKHQYSFQTGSRSCQVSNGIKGSIATDYAGLELDCTGVPDIPLPIFYTKCRRTKKSRHKNCSHAEMSLQIYQTATSQPLSFLCRIRRNGRLSGCELFQPPFSALPWYFTADLPRDARRLQRSGED